MRVIRDIPIGLIKMDRWAIQPATLALVKHIQSGGTVPPIHVAWIVGGFKICDGRHRVTAYRLLGRKHISARFAVCEHRWVVKERLRIEILKMIHTCSHRGIK